MAVLVDSTGAVVFSAGFVTVVDCNGVLNKGGGGAARELDAVDFEACEGAGGEEVEGEDGELRNRGELHGLEGGMVLMGLGRRVRGRLGG